MAAAAARYGKWNDERGGSYVGDGEDAHRDHVDSRPG
jgi:hypothetical protein